MMPSIPGKHMNAAGAMNCEPGISTFRLGRQASAHCITLNGEGDIPADSMIRNAAQKLKAAIVNQFVFADNNRYSASFNNTVAADTPVTGLINTVSGGKGMFSAQAIALSGIHKLEHVEVNGRKTGVVYEDDSARCCFLGNVIAQDVKASGPEQARMVLETFANAMARHGFKFAETVRTWFFNDHILDWYGEFNRARTEFFDKTGIFGKTVPASTGIGMGNPYGAALVGSAFAVQPKNGRVRIRAVPSPLQASALNYKSSFSRAVELEYPAHRGLLVSGTASISQDGQTVFADDIVAQIEHTLRVVAALLQSRKMDWQNIFRGIVYFKHPDYPEYFKDYCRKHEIPGSNLAVAFADLCRPGLLFEIELEALACKSCSEARLEPDSRMKWID